MKFYSTLLISILITIALIPLLNRLAVKLRVLDQPGGRKVHQTPVPRFGGIAMVIGAVLPTLYWSNGNPLVQAWLAGVAVLAVFGILDDVIDLNYKIKLAGQVIAALIVIYYGGVKVASLGALLPDGYLLPAWVAWPLTMVALVGVTNAINLSDGLDGLAGGICLLIFSALAYLAILSGSGAILLMVLAVVGCIFGFLRFNTFPATVFMGDTGSQFLGFSAVILAIALTQKNAALSPLLPLLLLGFPILDTLAVICIRISRKRSPFHADKNHFHHHLLKLGLYQPESVLVIYVMQTILIWSAICFRYHSEWLVIIAYLSFSLLVFLPLALADRKTVQFARTGFFDLVIKENLRKLRDGGHVIRVTFRTFEAGIPLLLLFVCLLPQGVPGYFPWISLGCAALLGGAWLIKTQYLDSVLRIVIYLTAPYMVYLSEVYAPPWTKGAFDHGFTALFGGVAVCIVIISKFSRRFEGFKSTPMDFLILYLVAMLLNIPDDHFPEGLFGVTAAKIIILYFSYEVLIAEARYHLGRITAYTVATCVLFSLKCFLL